MIKGLGMSYMGSKRKLAPKILTHIIKENPKAKYFFDLFGGGGSVSFMALQVKQFKEVHYNEYNPAIVNLLLHIEENGVTDDMYNWVSREDFKKNKDRTDYIGGLMTIVWSFGNNSENGYLFGKDLEPDKKMLHYVVVNNCLESINTLKAKFGFDFNPDVIHETFKGKDTEQRRAIISRVIKNKNLRMDIQQLERLEQLQQLERLQRLEQLDGLKITNLSYDEVEISTPIEETILYLDPPYQDTASYNKTIDFKKLEKFIKESPYKIYLSEYKNSYDMKLVKEYKHRGTLSTIANNEVTEKLFCNRW